MVLLLASIVLFVNVSVVSCKTIVPDAFGKLIVLSAVGSTTPNVVSNASAVEPSNVNELVTSIVDEFTVVVVPFTVKFPVIVVLPVTVSPSSIVIKDESVDERVVPDIPIAEPCIALVPFPKSIALAVCVTAPVPPCSTPINSPVWYSAKPVATLLSLKTVRIGVFTVICYSLKEK